MEKASNEASSGEKNELNDQKNNSKPKTSRKSNLDFRKYTKQIWLAGLGAFSRAEEEGNKLFDSLVQVGAELESKTSEALDQKIESVSDKAKDTVTEKKERVERILDQSLNHSLHRIGLVSAKDIQHLEQLVLQLHSKVDFLLEENKELKKQITEK
jgi:poly(hydroxyalkanoate) granule-associated protein